MDGQDHQVRRIVTLGPRQQKAIHATVPLLPLPSRLLLLAQRVVKGRGGLVPGEWEWGGMNKCDVRHDQMERQRGSEFLPAASSSSACAAVVVAGHGWCLAVCSACGVGGRGEGGVGSRGGEACLTMHGEKQPGRFRP